MAAMEGLDSVSKTRRQVSFPSGIALETTSSIQMPKMPGINSIEDLQAFVSPDKPRRRKIRVFRTSSAEAIKKIKCRTIPRASRATSTRWI